MQFQFITQTSKRNWEKTGLLTFNDKNNDGVLSREEIDDAIKLLKKAKRENPNLDKEIKKL